MKIIVEKSKMVKALSILKNGISSSPILPILENILVEIDDSVLKLRTTDNQITISQTIDCTVEGEGKFLLHTSAVKLIEALKDDLIKIEYVEANEAKNTASKVIIKQGKNKYKFPSEDSLDFPNQKLAYQNKESKELCVEFGNFKDILIESLKFVSKNESMYAMTGVYLEIEGSTLEITATDAHTLSTTRIENPSMKPLKEKLGIILPQKVINVLKSINFESDFCTLYLNESKMSLLVGDVSISSTLIDGVYPNFRAVIPKEKVGDIVIPKKELLSSLKRLRLLANSITSQVCMVYCPKGVAIFASDLDRSLDGIEILTEGVAITMNTKGGKIGFNSVFMANILNTLNLPNVTIDFSSDDGNKAMIMKEESESIERTTLMMPVMLDEDIDIKDIVSKIK